MSAIAKLEVKIEELDRSIRNARYQSPEQAHLEQMQYLAQTALQWCKEDSSLREKGTIEDFCHGGNPFIKPSEVHGFSDICPLCQSMVDESTVQFGLKNLHEELSQAKKSLLLESLGTKASQPTAEDNFYVRR